ncbi:laccase domain-containing protein [bacterium]|nr:laccase domain-containing protein [bacterium]
MDFTQINGLSIFHTQSLLEKGFIHGFTSKRNEGLQSPVFPARTELIDSSVILDYAQRLGLANHKLVFQKQVHTDNITIVKSADLKEQITVIPENDGLITNEPDICLFSMSADCLSLILVHVESGVIANAHCGRKGTILNLPTKLLVTMCREFALMPTDITALLGTSIAAQCYEVGDDVVSELIEKDPTALGFLLKKDKKRFFDLRGYVFYQLTSMGVNPQNIHSQSLCSHCHEDLFYSYRRDGKVLGSQAGFIAKKKEERS